MLRSSYACCGAMVGFMVGTCFGLALTGQRLVVIPALTVGPPALVFLVWLIVKSFREDKPPPNVVDNPSFERSPEAWRNPNN